MLRVAICIPTFKRPESLKRLLLSLDILVFRKESKPYIEILVVDNDSSLSAKRIVEALRHTLTFPVHYHVERHRGIPFVRNRLVRLSSGYDFMVFIDDDEIASKQWLDELLYVQKKYDADVVTGPVIAQYEITPPKWIIEGNFHNSERYKTGRVLNRFFTNNLLILRQILDPFEKPFEENMAFTGGTDKLLSMRLNSVAISARWADEAIVYEVVPSMRTTARWLFQRRYRYGNSMVLCDFYLNSRVNIITQIRALATSFLYALFLILLSTKRGYHSFIKGIGFFFQSAGIISGIFGKKYEEYQ